MANMAFDGEHMSSTESKIDFAIPFPVPATE